MGIRRMEFLEYLDRVLYGNAPRKLVGLGKDITDIGKKKRNNHAAYGTVTLFWREFPVFFQEVSLTPALRYDYPSDFTPELSPKVTLTLKHTSWLSLSLISHLTRSYRAPTFNDLYWPKDSFSEGNPNLVPETGINWDAGLSFTFPSLGDLTLTGNYFINNMENLILWAPGADGLWRPNNISKTESYGIETATRWKPLGEYVELAFDYMYMVALDKSDSKATYDKDLIYRPRNKFSATLTLRFGGVEMNALDHYVGKRYTTASNTKSLEAYNVVDANIGYSFWMAGLRFSAKFEVNNLTDLSYFPIEGSPVPGREFRFTVGVTI